MIHRHDLPRILGALLLLGALVAAGCGGDDDALPTYSANLLDPPDLARHVLTDGTPGVPVLCYHYFRADFDPAYLARVVGSLLFGLPALGDREFWTTPRAEFARHLKHFEKTNTRVMTLDEVAEFVLAGRELPERAVVLTIDDADRTVYEIAWPLLVEHDMRAHLFVLTGEVGRRWSELDVCSWEELEEMSASGHVLVESHTRALHFKVRTPRGHEPVFWHPTEIPDEVTATNRALLGDDPAAGDATTPLTSVAIDLRASRAEITRHLGTPPRWLAWPYGYATDALDSLALAAGFRGTVSLYPGRFTALDTTLHVGRVTLTAKTTIGEIIAVLPPGEG